MEEHFEKQRVDLEGAGLGGNEDARRRDLEDVVDGLILEFLYCFDFSCFQFDGEEIS